MLRIGLTGGIGSGKSIIANIFTVLGIPVFNADLEAKRIMETDERLIEAIQTAFGKETYSNGKLDRVYLSKLVFSDAYKLEKLNALVHPVVIKVANNWMALQKTPYAVKEAALIFESGSAEGLDYVIGVYAPKHIRTNRVIKRDGITREEALLRMNRQIDEEIKMRLCDFVIVNDEQQMVLPQVQRLHEQFIKEDK